jgi:uncharacterized protein
MGWFDFLHEHPAPSPATLEIPLFPLATVLFPDSSLPLRIFEQRYLDMTARCLREQQPFGICLIERGQEVGNDNTVPHPVGTLAIPGACDMQTPGILTTTVRGGRRFRIIERRNAAQGLQLATVVLLDEPAPALPLTQANLLPLLRRIINEGGPERFPEPHRFDDAAWVGYRLSEILPIQNFARQKLLELDDALSRLEIIAHYLTQHGLLG